MIAPSLLQGIDINKPVPPQFDIGWEELLGQVLQVPVSAPSGSANDYTGFIVKEGIDSLLLKAYQMFEHVNVEVTNFTSCFSKHLKSYEFEHCIVSRMPNVPVTRSSLVKKEKLLQVFQAPIMAVLRVLRLLRRYGSLQFQRR